MGESLPAAPREKSSPASTPASQAYFAHSPNAEGKWHDLAEHLRSVAGLAGEFAGHALWKDEASLAGLLHDLGKYAERFQARLRGEDQGLDHWSQGAWLALTECRAVGASLAIQGHHIGLLGGNLDALRRLDPTVLSRNHPLRLELSDPDPARLKQRAEADDIAFREPTHSALPLRNGMAHAVASMLDVRLLFSCLVDADFLDTEAHFEGDKDGKRYREPGPRLGPAEALAALDRYMRDRVPADSQADRRVLEAREKLWDAASRSAQAAPGLFTLTSPTGSGKTLAMLKFALDHAARRGLKRIVMVVPFLTIIEQTAKVYRAVFDGFPEHFLLEHHSLAGLGTESAPGDAEDETKRQIRLLSQNWDAPIVLTTNVQLLESLFSNRPSACRKLHNLMESVILFDEAQSLPPHLAVPTLAALSHLSAAYHSTVVFSTATQPAFDALHEPVQKHAIGGWRPTEAVPEHPALFAALKRVETHWPGPGKKQGWEKLADVLRGPGQALCVVNLKRHALKLMDALKGEQGVFHLSTNLCAEHRRAVLDDVRARLKRGDPCRLISTQCVEAGVDVDFPVVYRAMAPLEAIAQAAGRCNREGRMSEPGKVVVFDPDVPFDANSRRPWVPAYPTFAYYQAASVTQTMLSETGSLDINDPAIFRDYYRRLYNLNDPAARNPDLEQAILSLDFAEIARLYRLIDQDAIQVLVPWAEKRDVFEALKKEAGTSGIGSDWMRHAQGLAVGVYRPKYGHPAWGVLIPAKFRRGGVSDEWFILEDPQGKHYDKDIGLRLPESDQVFIA